MNKKDFELCIKGHSNIDLREGTNPTNNLVEGYRNLIVELISKTDGPLTKIDYGAGPKKSLFTEEQMKNGVREDDFDFAPHFKNASTKAEFIKVLTDIVEGLSPNNVLELGTNLGLSAFAMYSSMEKGNVTTIEGCPETSRLASEYFSKSSLESNLEKGIDFVVGKFNDVLTQEFFEERGKFDFVFIDGHHLEKPTIEYFDRIKDNVSSGAIIIIDDISRSDGMSEAWEKIKKDPKVQNTHEISMNGKPKFGVVQIG